jgi:hypothetical protein
LKSYTGSQALQAATSPILGAFSKRLERSSSGLKFLTKKSKEECCHTRGFRNGHVARAEQICNATADEHEGSDLPLI